LLSAEAQGFPNARRTYEAVELTFARAGGDRLRLQGSYTWSKNRGNSEGLVNSDNGNGQASLTESFDFPELTDGADGYLPNDRRHKLKIFGSYDLTEQLVLGAGLFVQSGRPINTFGISHPDGTPFYGNTFYLQNDDGSFEYVPRGSGGRTDWTTQLNLSAIYSFDIASFANVELRADIFNVLNSDNATEVYENAEPRPELLLAPTAYQRPRYVRVGFAARF
jgi:hypothetical protein